MAKPRKQTYTMDMYLNKVRDLDIRNDADVQRQFVWSNEQINELIVTVLTEDYIPSIILGEEDNSQLWIVDGGQRTAALERFRHGNYKVTSALFHSIVHYKAKARDENANVLTDQDNNIIWEDASFDIKNKTYEKLPEELKKKFNEYQIETVIHENCDTYRVSQLIKRYNNHTSMNTNQKAFTYLDKYARNVREILERRFFLDNSSFTEQEKTKGVIERVVVETVMCTGHLKNWKKQMKSACTYLNKNAAKEEFDRLSVNLGRLEAVIGENTRQVFNSKDAFLFLSLFDRFTELGIADSQFEAFLQAFQDGLREERVNGVLFDEIDKEKGTKDKAVIIAKLNHLENLLLAYLNLSASCNSKFFPV